MHDFLLFLGRFHVLALHLPIGIVLVAVALDWTAKRERFRALAHAAPLLWGVAALSAFATAVLGYLHFAEGTFSGPAAEAHRLFGTSVAVVTVAIWWLCARRGALYARLNGVSGVMVLALVTVTGHYGGELTHGATFLAEFAPGPLRALVGAAPPQAPAASLASADPALVARLSDAGFLVRQVSQSDARLVVSVYSSGTQITAERLTALLSAGGEIVELNLQDSGLDDAQLVGFERLPALTRLRLSNDRITDLGLEQLERLPKLESLNLYGNAGVTDAGLTPLARIATLRELYLWRTGVSAAAASALREQRPELDLQLSAAAPLTAVGE